MDKHTAGTWFFDKEEEQILRQDYEDGFTIIVPEVYVDDEESIANAHLIASAPELLEALEELVGSNERHNSSVAKIVGKPVGWHDGYLDKARAAIAKARGQQ